MIQDTVRTGGAGGGARGIGPVIVSSRTLAEYRAMFGLTEADLLAGPVLDVAGGASSFLADLHALGGTGVAVDPLYDRPAGEILAAAEAGAAKAVSFVSANPQMFPAHVADAPSAYLAEWTANKQRFAEHYRPSSEQYRAHRLPHLPFPDGTFHLALCSHFLFSYPDHLDHDLLLAGLLELCRVTAGEVRVYPLVDTVGLPYCRFDELRADLAAAGVRTTVEPVDYRLYVSGTHMLTLRRESAGA